MHYATVQGNQVEVVESFTYLESLIHCSGSSEPEIKRRVNIVREAMSMLDQNIWRSRHTRNQAASSQGAVIVFSRYSHMELRHGRWPWLYRGRLMHWIIGALGASWIYTGRNSLPTTRYAPALGSHFYPTLFAAAVCHSLDISIAPTLSRIIIELSRPGDWRRSAGRPRQSWFRTVEADLRPMNLGLATAKRRAQDRSAWQLLAAMATSSTSC